MKLTDVPDDLVTPQAASRLLGCHTSSIYRLLANGRLRGWRKFGSRLFISRSDLDAAIVRVEPRKRLV